MRCAALLDTIAVYALALRRSCETFPEAEGTAADRYADAAVKSRLEQAEVELK